MEQLPCMLPRYSSHHTNVHQGILLMKVPHGLSPPIRHGVGAPCGQGEHCYQQERKVNGHEEEQPGQKNADVESELSMHSTTSHHGPPLSKHRCLVTANCRLPTGIEKSSTSLQHTT